MIENKKLNKEVVEWGRQSLLSRGYILTNTLPEEVQHTPWSYVVRFSTSAGLICLKHMPKLIALESTITRILHDKFDASVPEIIADNTELNCFLMKDAGRSLREKLKQKLDLNLLARAINQFTLLQLAVSNHVDDLLI